ncbi:MAG: hypothetical protein ACK54X_04145 [Burkholderiales bacterium]
MAGGWRATLATAAIAAGTTVAAASGLTDLERRWLDAASPVLADARREGLLLDVVVQPQPNAGEPPLALAWVGGRCKLVATMRGPGGAPLPASEVDPALAPERIRTMVAHEVGHCLRHVRGAWGGAPAGFSAVPGARPADAAIAAARLEEGFADLYALAWIAAHEPAAYAGVHRWLAAERAEPAHDGAEHDTRDWVAAASDAAALAGPGTPYERAERLWRSVADRADRGRF